MEPCRHTKYTDMFSACFTPLGGTERFHTAAVFLRVLQLEEEVRCWDVVRKRFGVAHAQVLTSDSLRIL